jgi:ferric-dicitrate binding protein FerR (iron transport regulator)
MNKKNIIKELIRKYIEGKLSDAEEENLFFLIQDKEFENSIYCEQYNLWNETPEKNKHLPSEEIFKEIKEKLNITDDKLRQDDLILKGLIFQDTKSRKRRIYTFLKYAAVLFIAVFLSSLVYYNLTITGKKKDITYHEITVPYGSKIKILLADSSVVWLNSGSTLTYPNRFAEVNREVFLEGEAFFEIHKSYHKPFYVRTYDINIKVLGTSFNVKAYPEEDIVETTLISGYIQIEENEKEGKRAEKISVQSQQKAIYLKKSRQLSLETKESFKSQPLDSKKGTNLVNIDDLQKIQDMDIETSWKDNRLLFRDEQLSNLAKKLERWYNVEIEIKDDEIGNYKFTGSIKNETIEQVMEAFKFASSLDYEIHKNKIEITKSNKKTMSN